MSDKNDKLNKIEYKIIFIYCIMFSLLFFSALYFGSDMFSNEVTAPQDFTYNSYINSDEWTEKCVEYQEYEDYYIYKSVEKYCLDYVLVPCYEDYSVKCTSLYLECVDTKNNIIPYMKIINKSRCVETILVKVI